MTVGIAALVLGLTGLVAAVFAIAQDDGFWGAVAILCAGACLGLVFVADADGGEPGARDARCRTDACWERVREQRREAWARRHPLRTAHSTAYCLLGTMANGRGVHAGAVAMNRHPLGTRISVRRNPYGAALRRFRVEDRIGHGSELDFWVPSCDRARAWGRRTVTYRVLGR
jgi:3D (Asp-Asp-Asp) domain-containing protein